MTIINLSRINWTTDSRPLLKTGYSIPLEEATINITYTVNNNVHVSNARKVLIGHMDTLSDAPIAISPGSAPYTMKVRVPTSEDPTVWQSNIDAIVGSGRVEVASMSTQNELLTTNFTVAGSPSGTGLFKVSLVVNGSTLFNAQTTLSTAQMGGAGTVTITLGTRMYVPTSSWRIASFENPWYDADVFSIHLVTVGGINTDLTSTVVGSDSYYNMMVDPEYLAGRMASNECMASLVTLLYLPAVGGGSDPTLAGRVSALESDVTDLTSDLADETAARSQADTALGGRIDSEVANRRASDTSLENQITTEVTNRETADNSISAQISIERTARIAADQDLQSQIDSLEPGSSGNSDSDLKYLRS